MKLILYVIVFFSFFSFSVIYAEKKCAIALVYGGSLSEYVYTNDGTTANNSSDDISNVAFGQGVWDQLGIRYSYDFLLLRYKYGFDEKSHFVDMNFSNDMFFFQSEYNRIKGRKLYEQENWKDSPEGWVGGSNYKNAINTYTDIESGYVFSLEYGIIRPFSYRYFFYLNESPQEKIQINLAVMGSVVYQYSEMKSDKDIIPETMQVSYGEYSSFRGSKIHSATGRITPIVNLVFYNFFCGFGARYDIFPYKFGEIDLDSDKKYSNLNYCMYSGYFSKLGVVTDSFFCSFFLDVSYLYTVEPSGVDNFVFEDRYLSFEVEAGTRF